MRELYEQAERDAEEFGKYVPGLLAKRCRRQSSGQQTDVPVVLDGGERLGEDVGSVQKTESLPRDAESEATFSNVDFPYETGFAKKWNHCVKLLHHSIWIIGRAIHSLSISYKLKNFSCVVNPSKCGSGSGKQFFVVHIPFIGNPSTRLYLRPVFRSIGSGGRAFFTSTTLTTERKRHE